MNRLIVAAAALLLPAAVLAQDAPAAPPADAGMPAAATKPLPKCTAKIQDSCDQSTTTEKNALNYYPADSRDAGNNKIAGMRAKKPM